MGERSSTFGRRLSGSNKKRGKGSEKEKTSTPRRKKARTSAFTGS